MKRKNRKITILNLTNTRKKIEEKGQPLFARNKNNEKKEVNENRENTKNKINQRIEQSNEIKMKKARRSKKIKILTNFKVFYQNARGLNSKIDPLMETVSDYQTMLICLIETHLQKEVEIRISGYSRIFLNDRSGISGSIILELKENIRPFTLEVPRKKELYMPHKKK